MAEPLPARRSRWRRSPSASPATGEPVPTRPPASTSPSTASATSCSRAPATTTSSATSRCSRSSEFAGMVYDVVGSTAVQLDGDLRADFDLPDYPAEWPVGLPAAVGERRRCAACCTPASTARDPAVSLATNPTGDADPADIPPGSHVVDVEPSAGAYVLSGSDASGRRRHPLRHRHQGREVRPVGALVPESIGYGDVDPPMVPSTWLQFFESGVDLTTNNARRVPEDAPPPGGGAGRGRRLVSRVRTTLAAGLLAAAVVPVWAGPAAADHAAPCSVGELPDSERLADTHTEGQPGPRPDARRAGAGRRHRQGREGRRDRQRRAGRRGPRRLRRARRARRLALRPALRPRHDRRRA